MGKYISDVIGDDYKSWIDENKIIISSPTGSGKTSFVWNVLFPYAKAQNKSIVYFCNHVLLKRQVIQNAEAIREEEIIISEKERGADIFLHSDHTFISFPTNSLNVGNTPRLLFIRSKLRSLYLMKLIIFYMTLFSTTILIIGITIFVMSFSIKPVLHLRFFCQQLRMN